MSEAGLHHHFICSDPIGYLPNHTTWDIGTVVNIWPIAGLCDLMMFHILIHLADRSLHSVMKVGLIGTFALNWFSEGCHGSGQFLSDVKRVG
jgi:hypothetical protein